MNKEEPTFLVELRALRKEIEGIKTMGGDRNGIKNKE